MIRREITHFRLTFIFHMFVHVTLILALGISWRAHAKSEQTFEERLTLARQDADQHVKYSSRGGFIAGRASQTRTWLWTRKKEGLEFVGGSKQEALLMVDCLFDNQKYVNFPENEIGNLSLMLASDILDLLDISTYEQFVIEAEQYAPIEDFGFIVYAKDPSQYSRQLREFVEAAIRFVEQ